MAKGDVVVDIRVERHKQYTPPTPVSDVERAVPGLADTFAQLDVAIREMHRALEVMQYQFIEMLENMELMNARMDEHLDQTWRARLKRWRKKIARWYRDFVDSLTEVEARS
jgi:t-SNARE complex subunit (syntaxin)